MGEGESGCDKVATQSANTIFLNIATEDEGSLDDIQS